MRLHVRHFFATAKGRLEVPFLLAIDYHLQTRGTSARLDWILGDLMTNNLIITGSLAEDPAVFRTRFWRFYRLQHLIACRVLGGPERADDAIENCWLRASLNPSRFEYEGAFRSWLIRVLIDEALAIRGHDQEERNDASLRARLFLAQRRGQVGRNISWRHAMTKASRSWDRALSMLLGNGWRVFVLGFVVFLVVLSSCAADQGPKQSTPHVPVVENLVQLLEARPDLRAALESAIRHSGLAGIENTEALL